jgi:NADPH:quinone reductase-like Zn-dependent oxidoreductase
MNEKTNKSFHSSFQNYTVVKEHMTSPIPETLSFEKAAVMPLWLSTAACGMFQKGQLGLEFPTVPRSKAGNGKALLVWGGSTSVGVNAIQVRLSIVSRIQPLERLFPYMNEASY